MLLTDLKKYWKYWLPVVLLGGYSLGLLYQYLTIAWPFFSYPYDWEPIEGDILNAIVKIKKGIPLYQDWSTGNIQTDYVPLLHFTLALGSLLGFDPITLGRVLNVLWMVLSFGILSYLFSRGESKDSNLTDLGVGLGAAILAFTPYLVYFHAFNVKTDPIGLLLKMVGLLFLTFYRHRTTWVAFVLGLACLANQSALSLVLAAIVIYWFFDNKHFYSFFLASVGIAAGMIGVLEWMNRGYFLQDAYINLFKMTGEEYLSFEHALYLLRGYYSSRLWVVPFAFLGWIAAWRTALRPVALFYLFETLLSINSARNNGGSSYYLWLHWMLTCGFCVLGIRYGIESIAKWMKVERYQYQPFFLLLMVALSVYCFDHFQRGIFRHQPLDLFPFKKVSELHQEKIEKVIRDYPKGKWISNRASMALVRAGVLLDQGMCTLNYALSDPKVLSAERFISRIVSGEYMYLQTYGSSCAQYNPITPVLDACFETFETSSVVVLGEIKGVELKRFDPNKKSCKMFAQKHPTQL